MKYSEPLIGVSLALLKYDAIFVPTSAKFRRSAQQCF
jgi:hypothetical protein